MESSRGMNVNGRCVRLTRLLALSVVGVLLVSAVPMVLPRADFVQNAAAAEYYVNVGVLWDQANWNPLNPVSLFDYVAYNLMYSVLFQYNEDWEGPVNDLATDYTTVNHPSGNMTLYVNITHNAYFRNLENINDKSHQLTAEDVAFTINLIKNNPGGAWDYYLGAVTGANATGTFQVGIDVEFPKATLFDDLVMIPILPKYIWENDPNALGSKDPSWLVGSGPFVYNSSLKTQWYRFTRAPNYHGSSDYPLGSLSGDRVVKVDGIVYRYYSNANLMVTAMNAGELDAIDISGSPNMFVNQVSNRFNKMAAHQMGITDVAINAIPVEFRRTTEGGYGQGNPLLLDPIVREAIAMTINKSYIAETLCYGLTDVAFSVLSPGYWQCDIQGKLPYDTTAAKNLLLANGYANLDSDPQLEATSDAYPVKMGWATAGSELRFRLQAVSSIPNYEAIGTNLVGWARNAGIVFDFSLESDTVMTYGPWLHADYDVWIWGWYWVPEPLNDLGAWLTSQMSSGGVNCEMPMGPWYYNEANSSTGQAYSAYDENHTAALREFDRADRKVIVDKLQQWIHDSRAETPLIYSVGLYATSNARYTGWGDWSNHAGRSVSSALLWLWFDLESKGGNQMPEFTLPLNTEYQFVLNDTQTFTITVRDPEGDPINVTWDFGDGQTSTNSSSVGTTNGVTFTKTHVYSTLALPPNGFAMNVTASDGNPSNTATSYATVCVFPLPDAVPELTIPILSDPIDKAYRNQDVTWTVGARDAETGGPSGTGLQFTWDWDDGTYTTTLYQPTTKGGEVIDTQIHNWSVPGWYNVGLWVSDGSLWPGHNVSTSIPFEVVLNQPPEAPVISSITGNRDIDIECWASSSDVDPDALRFTWVWGDGTFNVTESTPLTAGTTAVSTAVHSWSAQGAYPVTVWVDDLTGEPGHNISATVDAVISGPGAHVPPSSLGLVAVPNPAYPDSDVIFNASAVDTNSDALELYLEFGDGNASQNSTAGGTTARQYFDFVHKYSDTGTYTATLWANDGTDNVSKAITMVVKENSPPWLILSSGASAMYNKTFTLTPARVRDNDSDPLSVTYLWGDGEMSTGASPKFAGTHVYEMVGEVNVTVYVDDGTGLPGHNVSGVIPVIISENFKPRIDGEIVMMPEKDLYRPDEQIMFTVVVSDYEGDILNLTVDFGDGTDPTVVSNITVSPGNEPKTVFVNHTFSEGRSIPYVATFTVDDGQMAYHSVKTWNSRTLEVSVEAQEAANWALWGGVAAVVVIFVLVLLWFFMRKKTPAEVGGMEGTVPPVQDASGSAPAPKQ